MGNVTIFTHHESRALLARRASQPHAGTTLRGQEKSTFLRTRRAHVTEVGGGKFKTRLKKRKKKKEKRKKRNVGQGCRELRLLREQVWDHHWPWVPSFAWLA